MSQLAILVAMFTVVIIVLFVASKALGSYNRNLTNSAVGTGKRGGKRSESNPRLHDRYGI